MKKILIHIPTKNIFLFLGITLMLGCNNQNELSDAITKENDSIQSAILKQNKIDSLIKINRINNSHIASLTEFKDYFEPIGQNKFRIKGINDQFEILNFCPIPFTESILKSELFLDANSELKREIEKSGIVFQTLAHFVNQEQRIGRNEYETFKYDYGPPSTFTRHYLWLPTVQKIISVNWNNYMQNEHRDYHDDQFGRPTTEEYKNKIDQHFLINRLALINDINEAKNLCNTKFCLNKSEYLPFEKQPVFLYRITCANGSIVIDSTIVPTKLSDEESPQQLNENVQSNANDKNDNANVRNEEEVIKNFLDAEANRDFKQMQSFLSDNITIYWKFKNPRLDQIEKACMANWNLISSSNNKIEKIEKIDDLTFNLHTTFEYTLKSNGKTKAIKSIVRYKFDKDGKLIEIYGLN